MNENTYNSNLDTWEISTIRSVTIKTKNRDPGKENRPTFKYVDVSSVSSSLYKVVNVQEVVKDEAPSRARKDIKKNEDFVQEFTFSKHTFDMIMICTDGVSSFRKTEPELGHSKPTPTKDVIQQITKIKSTKGEFVTRRMKSFLSKFCVTNGWDHADDVTVAGIYMGE